MSFSTDYTDYKIAELKELGVHPEQPDAAYKITSKDFKDYSTINKVIMGVMIAPIVYLTLGVVLASPRHQAEPAAEPAEEVQAEAAAPAKAEPAATDEVKAEENAKEEAMPAGEGDAKAQ